MATDQIPLRCRCGSTQFRFPRTNPGPGDVVTCTGCGASARYGELRRQVVDAVRQQLRQSLQQALRGVQGVKLR